MHFLVNVLAVSDGDYHDFVIQRFIYDPVIANPDAVNPLS